MSTTDHEVAPAEAWDAIAADYDEFVAPGEASFANEGLRLAGLKPGERFLDVAAGPGGLSLPAARLGAKRAGDGLVAGDDRTVRGPRP